MEDQNQNMIPDRVDRAILKIGTIIMGLIGAAVTALGQSGKPVPLWLGILAVAVPVVLGYFAFTGQSVKPDNGPKTPSGWVAGAVVFGLIFLGCSASPAVIATHGTMNAAKLTDSTIAEVHKAGKLDCKQVKLWRTHGRRAVRVAVMGAVVAIKAQKNPDYISLLKPGACELFRWLDAAAKDAPDKAAKAMAYLGSFKALVCPKGKSAAGVAAILGIILPAAQQVIQWIHSLAGSTDDKLLAEVDAWLADAPDGPTDAICKD